MINLNEIQLEQLNNKFYQIKTNFGGKNELFPFFYANRNKIYELFANIFHKIYLLNFEKINISRNEFLKQEEVYITETEFKNLSMEFFSTIDNEYLKKLQVDFDYSELMEKQNELQNSDANGIFNQYTGKITLKNTNTLNDCRIFAHEYAHKLSHKNDNTNQLVFGEMIAIFIEFKFLDFLNNKGYNNFDISKIKFKRFEQCFNDMSLFLLIYPLYCIYNAKGKITNEDINKLILQKIIMYGNENNVIANLNSIINSPNINLKWRHSFGTVLACCLNQNYISYRDCYSIIESAKILEFNELAPKLLCYSNSEMIGYVEKEFESYIKPQNTNSLKH